VNIEHRREELRRGHSRSSPGAGGVSGALARISAGSSAFLPFQLAIFPANPWFHMIAIGFEHRRCLLVETVPAHQTFPRMNRTAIYYLTVLSLVLPLTGCLTHRTVTSGGRTVSQGPVVKRPVQSLIQRSRQ
jgi:hypothetical protein